MPELIIPTLNSNDETYVLVEWLVPAAAAVCAGDCVATVETSKAVSDLVCDHAGFLAHRVAAGAICRPGEVVAHVYPSEAEARAHGSASAPEPPAREGMVITRPARDLMQRHGITEAAVAALGKPLVKSADLASLIGHSDSAVIELSRHQQAVARTVSTSHATIPSAFAVAKVSAMALLEQRRTLPGGANRFIGLVEYVIKAVATLHPRFPMFFASVDDGLVARTAGSPDCGIGIGITIDVGTGLYVPVIRRAESRSIVEVGAQLLKLRTGALRGTLSESDLTGADLTLALHTEPGIVLARPVVFPGQTCMLSLCATQEELRLDPAGKVVPHSWYHLGIAYDHRFINGHDAMRFLTALRELLEQPERLAELASPHPDRDNRETTKST